MKFNVPEIFKNDIKKAIKILKSIGCSEIYLFGSEVNKNFRKDSDIDIAIKDCPPNKFYYAIGKLLSELEHSVDLIDLNYEKDFFKFSKDEKELIRIA